MKTLRLVCILLAVALLSGLCAAYPQPKVVPGVGDWTLEVVFEHPKQITLRLPGEEGASRFWYVILTLTNNSPATDTPFYPACHVVTDTFKIIEAGRKVNDEVFRRIKLRHQGRYPFLEYIDRAGDKILQGRDNTVDVVVIWPDFDPRAKNVTFMIAGLSNETVVIDHPMARDDSGGAQKVFLRKTLALEYSSGGDKAFHDTSNLAFKRKRWIMR